MRSMLKASVSKRGSRRYSSLREGAQYNSLLLADREKLVGLDYR